MNDTDYYPSFSDTQYAVSPDVPFSYQLLRPKPIIASHFVAAWTAELKQLVNDSWLVTDILSRCAATGFRVPELNERIIANALIDAAFWTDYRQLGR